MTKKQNKLKLEDAERLLNFDWFGTLIDDDQPNDLAYELGEVLAGLNGAGDIKFEDRMYYGVWLRLKDGFRGEKWYFVASRYNDDDGTMFPAMLKGDKDRYCVMLYNTDDDTVNESFSKVIASAKEVVDRVKADYEGYRSYIQDNLPYCHRTGKIQRDDLQKIVPAYKQDGTDIVMVLPSCDDLWLMAPESELLSSIEFPADNADRKRMKLSKKQVKAIIAATTWDEPIFNVSD